MAQSGQPAFFAVDEALSSNLAPPERDGRQRVRVWARSLSGMQKEAIVGSSHSGALWRLASDEGPYLDGFDAAPCPLAFMTVGMVSAYTNALHAAARRRELDLHDVVLVQDNRYTMEGSALQGTMTGGALPVGLEARIASDVDEPLLRELVAEAVAASPVEGLQREVHTSRFTLTVNGEAISLGRASPLVGPVALDPESLFAGVHPTTTTDGGLVTRLEAVTPESGVAGGIGSSLRAEQRRELHVRAECRRRPDGVNEVCQELHSPLGSTFRMLSHDGNSPRGSGLAPDAASYMAAGVAFCFMTQLGRFATIMKRALTGYRLVQDTYYAMGEHGRPGAAGAVETHVFLDTTDGADFARQCLDMGEQTCFLHALYRTSLQPRVTITRI